MLTNQSSNAGTICINCDHNGLVSESSCNKIETIMVTIDATKFNVYPFVHQFSNSSIFFKSFFRFWFLDIYKCPKTRYGKKSWKKVTEKIILSIMLSKPIFSEKCCYHKKKYFCKKNYLKI
jgi:hypothetical protein